MTQNITESTLSNALNQFDIKTLPTAWNGHYEFRDCIIKVQKTYAVVYMSGLYDKLKPAKVRATIDHSKGQGGQILKFLEIYPVIKDANTEPVKSESVKLDEDEKQTKEYPFVLPEIKTLDDAREFIRKNGGEARGLANIGEETAKERIMAILDSQKLQTEQTEPETEKKLDTPPPHPADEIDTSIVQNELNEDEVIEENEEKRVEL